MKRMNCIVPIQPSECNPWQMGEIEVVYCREAKVGTIMDGAKHARHPQKSHAPEATVRKQYVLVLQIMGERAALQRELCISFKFVGTEIFSAVHKTRKVVVGAEA